MLFAADHFPGERNGKTVGRMCATAPHVVEVKKSQNCDSCLSNLPAFFVEESRQEKTDFLILI